MEFVHNFQKEKYGYLLEHTFYEIYAESVISDCAQFIIICCTQFGSVSLLPLTFHFNSMFPHSMLVVLNVEFNFILHHFDLWVI
jgi:hypothetical protein